MKYLILSTLLILTSCGISEQLREDCGSDIEMGCNAIFGYKDKDQDSKLKELENRITDLENQIEDNIQDINNLSGELSLYEDSNDSEHVNLLNQINTVQTTLNANLVSLTNQVISQQTTITTTQNTLTTLSNSLNNSVSQIIDPCGTTPNVYNEVILKTRSGEFLAYFENNSKRFLTKLTNGNYVTTDGTNCSFSINNNNLTW